MRPFGLAHRVPDPVLSPQLFRIRAFELISLTGFLLGLTLSAANIYLLQHRNASWCTPSCPAGRRITGSGPTPGRAGPRAHAAR